MYRDRRRQITEGINEIEKIAFASLNSSIGWLGIMSSIFGAEF